MKENERAEMYGKMCLAVERIERCKEFAVLIPEVRTNFVYAASDAVSPDDVLAIDGRITVRGGMPHACGRPRYGASSHMARAMIEIRKTAPWIRAAINFANDSSIVEWLNEYCREKGWEMIGVDRSREPEEIRDTEQASMPWKVRELLRVSGGRVPKLFYESGAVGKEPVTVLVGEDPLEVAREMTEIARRYVSAKTPAPKIGKIDYKTFTDLILNNLGKKDPTVLVPPMTGIDAGVIDIGNGKVLIIAEDPIFAAPDQPWDLFGWYTVHIGASDVAVMGVAPQYMTYSLLLPPGTPHEVLQTIVTSIHRAALDLGISIVGGHTGYYPGFVAPTIGGVTVFSIADRGSYVTPAGAMPGDDILLTKGPAIEAAGVLAMVREAELRERMPPDQIDQAKKLVTRMSVVADALIARDAGGVTAMHDATEGGVIGGLFEIANASGVGMEVDESLFIYPEEVRLVCEAFEIDPLSAIAEGSLLITARPGHAVAILAHLKLAGIDASVIGKVTDDPEHRAIRRRDGRSIPIEIPDQDPFWPCVFADLPGMGGN